MDSKFSGGKFPGSYTQIGGPSVDSSDCESHSASRSRSKGGVCPASLSLPIPDLWFEASDLWNMLAPTLPTPWPLDRGVCLPICRSRRHSEPLAISLNIARRFNCELPHFVHIFTAKAHRRQNTNKSPGPKKSRATVQRKRACSHGPKLVSFFSPPFFFWQRRK